MRILIGLAALALAAPASAEKVVVTADRMVDVLTGRMVENPAVFIGDDGRIRPSPSADGPAGARTSATSTLPERRCFPV